MKFLFTLLSAGFLLLQPAYAQEVAKLSSREGTVEARAGARGPWTGAENGHPFVTDDAVRTARYSRAQVKMTEGFLVRMNELSTIEFSARTAVRIGSGAAFFFSREARQYPEIVTPVVSAAVRGTEFVVKTTDQESTISVLNGSVEVRNQFGSVSLRDGEEAYARAGQAPVKRIMVNPLDSVEWALYYPAILELAELTTIIGPMIPGERSGWDALQRGDLGAAATAFTGSGTAAVMGRAVLEYRRGRTDRALAELSAAPPGPARDVLEASLLLSNGQVDEAQSALARADGSLAAAPPEARAVAESMIGAQRSIIALTKNQRDEAVRQAAEARGRAATAAVALADAYVAQSRFDLEGSLRALEEAEKLAPRSALVLARRAEILLAFGERHAAKRVAEKALELGEDDYYPLVTSGFVALSNYDTDEARRYFERAITADPAAGLAHLGLGLALIREGALVEGREELELATHLEPAVSLFRSYLGKAYFEEDREEKSEKELERAKELDPDDPTPYLYSAFQRLATFRPVEALEQIQESIARNDNRAVYRSSLLLDQDEAVRSASIGQIYRSLGFNRPGRQEAIKSVQRDYSNFSAHRLLADSYGDDPSLSQASLSEVLIANLLAPVNFNSLFPGTTSQASLNEYTSLFDMPNAKTRLEGLYRTEDETIGAGALYARSFGTYGYALQYSPQYTRGYRTNDYRRTHVTNGAFRYEPTPDDRFILRAGFVADEGGDRIGSPDPYDTDPDFERDIQSAGFNIGYTHQFGPRLFMLFEGGYSHNRIRLEDDMLPSLIGFNVDGIALNDDLALLDQRSRSTSDTGRESLQLIYDSDPASAVIGVEMVDSHVFGRESSFVSADELGVLTGETLMTSSSIDERSRSAFGYLTLHPHDTVDITGGLSYRDIRFGRTPLAPFNDEEGNESGLLPKAGLSWYPTPDLTIRTAYFQTLGIAGFSTIETIEPTLVGGINQLTDDTAAAEGETFALALDWEATKRTFLGIEASRRSVTRPVLAGMPSISVITDPFSAQGEVLSSTDRSISDDELLRAYVNRVFTNRFTGSLDHFWLVQDDDVFDDETRTHRSRLELNYFDPSGLYAFGTATWRLQDIDSSLQESINGERDFWILGAGVGYQLPNRRGTVVFAVNNILDQGFKYRFTGLEPTVLPEVSFTLAFSVVL